MSFWHSQVIVLYNVRTASKTNPTHISDSTDSDTTDSPTYDYSESEPDPQFEYLAAITAPIAQIPFTILRRNIEQVSSNIFIVLIIYICITIS